MMGQSNMDSKNKTLFDLISLITEILINKLNTL